MPTLLILRQNQKVNSMTTNKRATDQHYNLTFVSSGGGKQFSLLVKTALLSVCLWWKLAPQISNLYVKLSLFSSVLCHGKGKVRSYHLYRSVPLCLYNVSPSWNKVIRFEKKSKLNVLVDVDNIFWCLHDLALVYFTSKVWFHGLPTSQNTF